jgi:pilus assembly protein CpaB
MSMRVAVVGLMFVTALILGLFAYQLGNRPARPTPVAQAPTVATVMVSYLVAARPLPAGTLARTDDFTVKTVPADQVPPGAIIDSPDTRAVLRSSLVRHYVATGTTLTSADLMQSHERGFLATVLTPGTRAVSIGVNPVTGVAGLVWPGDHVDVILTQDIAASAGRTEHLVTSETVLANVRVLAVDQDIAQGAPTNGNAAAAGKLASTVTIQATADQAERLAVATQLGHLSLAVRAAEDTRDIAGNTVSGADVSSALARAGIGSGARVQVIQGDQRGEVTFR